MLKVSSEKALDGLRAVAVGAERTVMLLRKRKARSVPEKQKSTQQRVHNKLLNLLLMALWFDWRRRFVVMAV